MTPIVKVSQSTTTEQRSPQSILFTGATREQLAHGGYQSTRLVAVETLGWKLIFQKCLSARALPMVRAQVGERDIFSAELTGNYCKALDALLEVLLAYQLSTSNATLNNTQIKAAQIKLSGVDRSSVFGNLILSYQAGVDIVQKMTCDVESARREYLALQALNGNMAGQGLPLIFPKVFDLSEEPPSLVMERIRGRPLYEVLKDRGWRAGDEYHRTILKGFGEPDTRGQDASWHSTLVALFRQLAPLYAGSLAEGAPHEAQYIYGERFSNIVRREDFLRSFADCVHCEGPTGRLSFAELSEIPISINGMQQRSYCNYVTRVLTSAGAAVTPPGVRCLIHGDLHVANVIWRESDQLPIFIDPKSEWDGQALAEVATGDPLQDIAFLFHSLELIEPILGTVDDVGPLSELKWQDDQLTLQVPLLFDPAGSFTEMIHELCLAYLPPASVEGNWQRRLHVGIACAYLGWLKHRHVIQNTAQWLSIYGAVLWHLGIADNARATTSQEGWSRVNE